MNIARLVTLTALLLAVPAVAFSQQAEPASGGPNDVAPLVVKIHADWCGKCAMIQPTWARVEEVLGEDAQIVVLDVTNKETAEAASARAAELGLSDFFRAFRARTGTVAVFPAGATEPTAVLVAETDFEAYRAAIAEAS